MSSNLPLATRVISELASEMALIPLVWLGWLRVRNHVPGVAWWWLAVAFSISWVADTGAFWVNPWMVSPLYLVSQAGLVGAVFLSERAAMGLVLFLGATAVSAVKWRGIEGPDVLLHTVAWLSVVGIIWQLPQLERLRTSLLIYFGLGWFFWMCYAANPGWTSWGLYQTTRLIGILLFCWAAASPKPHLTLSR